MELLAFSAALEMITNDAEINEETSLLGYDRHNLYS